MKAPLVSVIALTLGDVVVYGGAAVVVLLVLLFVIVVIVFVAGVRALAHNEDGDPDEEDAA